MVVPSLKSKQTGAAHLLIIAVVVLVVIGGIAAYVLTGGFGTKTVTATTPNEVKDLIVSAKAGEYDAKCTYSNETAAATDNSDAVFKATGTTTLYIKGEKTRMDATISGKSSHFLQLDDSMYIWSDGKDKGSKFPIVDDEDSTNNFAEDAEKTKMTCESANLGDDLFELPSGVNFVEPKTQFHSSSDDN